MKTALCLLSGLWAMTAAYGDWPTELTAGKGTFPALRPFHAHYHFGWGLLGAAEADFNYARAQPGVMRLVVEAKSTGVVRNMWRMDTRHSATMHADTLMPLGVTQSEAYKDETIVTQLNFTPDGVARLREGRGPKPVAGKWKQFKFTPVYDLQSGLQFVRSQRLAQGDIYKIVVYPGTTPYLAEVDVVGRQKLKAAGQNWNTIKLDLKLWRINKAMELEKHEKFKRCSAWLSDDGDRVLLRVESEIFVGSVFGEVDKVEWK